MVRRPLKLSQPEQQQEPDRCVAVPCPLLAAADHLIGRGPGGGPEGGRILAAGTPEDVARAPSSATGPWLAEHLGLPVPRTERRAP
jgi:hypothetical protein